MTSQASLIKERKHSPFWVNFLNSFRETAILPALVLGFLSLLYPLSSFLSIRGIIKGNIMENPTYEIAKDFKYILTSEEMAMSLTMLIPYILLFAGILLGVSKLKFLLRKNTVNVYLSLGISRKNLFSSTYLSGVAQLFIAVFVPMLTVFFINLGYFGYSKELLLSSLILGVGFFAIALFGFTVSSIITSAVGTSFEAFLYSTIVIFLPMIAFACTSELMSLFLLGNEYALANKSLSYMLNIDAASLSEKYSYLVPNSFMSENISTYNILNSKNTVELISNFGEKTTLKWAEPSFTSSIGWLITSCVGYFVGLFVFSKRKAEAAGFIGANRVVNFIITFILGFTSFCVFNTLFNEFLPRTTSILLSVLVFIIVYMIINIVLTRKIKLFVKGLKMLPVQLAVAFAICLFFITGLFGYSSRQPKIEDIKSIDITVPSGLPLGLSASQGSGYNSSASFSEMHMLFEDITSTQDIEKVLEIHKRIIADGRVKFDEKKVASSNDDIVFGNFYIQYTLKDGSKITRYYEDVKVSTLIKMLELEDTRRFDETLDEMFTKPVSKDDDQRTISIKNNLQSSDSKIFLLSKNLDIKSPVNLSAEKRTELQKCILEDLKAQSIYDRYMPKSEALGVISFVGTFNNNNEDYDFYKEVEKKKNGTEEVLTTDMLTSLSNIAYGSPIYSVFVTQDMSNTVKFLEENALLKQFENDTKIVSAEIIDRNVFMANSPWELTSNYATSYQFVGGRTPIEFIKENQNDYYNPFINSHKISDSNTIAELYRNSYFSYFSPTGGYFVRYTLSSGDKTVMFIPDNKVPNKIKDSVSKIDTSKAKYDKIMYAY